MGLLLEKSTWGEFYKIKFSAIRQEFCLLNNAPPFILQFMVWYLLKEKIQCSVRTS